MCWRHICSWIHHLSSGSYWYSLKCLEDDLYNIAWCIFTLSILVLNCPDNCSTEVLYLLLLYFTSCLTLWWCSWLLTGNTWCYLFRETDPMTNRTISRLLSSSFIPDFSSATAFSEADIDGNISRVYCQIHCLSPDSFMMCLCVSVVESIIIFRFIVSCIHWNVLKTYLQLDPSFIFRFILIFTEMSWRWSICLVYAIFSCSPFQYWTVQITHQVLCWVYDIISVSHFQYWTVQMFHQVLCWVYDIISVSQFQYWTVQMFHQVMYAIISPRCFTKWCAGCRLLFQSLTSSTEQSRCIRSDVLGVGYYLSLLVPVLNCLDVSPRDVLGVRDYCSLSFPVLNSPDVSEVMCWV